MAQRRPTLVVVAGPNGAGKTTLTSELRARAWFRGLTYINPDQIAQDEFGDWNAPTARSRAALRAANLVAQNLRARSSFALETVLSTNGVHLMQRAMDNGYLVRFYFVGTGDPAINVARVAARVAAGGHDIPEATIRRRYHEAVDALPGALAIAHHGHVYDNSVPDRAIRRLFRTQNGILRQQYSNDIPDWVLPTLENVAP